ncbi:MAG: 4-hydroxyphenylacetate decarboxylase small subunit [Bacteroidales bacterium]|nr:4-hydroxyphenylacetate decarboxylase small subunit [Bacteroidales bacterium]
MRCYDCIYYLATDVFKGFCKRDKSRIHADAISCDDFEQAWKCKNCLHFSKNGEEVGMCMEKYEAFSEMNATNCNDYQWSTN